MRPAVLLCGLLIVPSVSWAQSRAELIAEATASLAAEEQEGAGVVVVDPAGTERVLRGSANGLLCRLHPGVFAQCYEASMRQLFLSATTRLGLPVRGLRVGEVVLEQPGAACTVMGLEPETDRMRIALLVDNSRSVGQSLNPLRTGVQAFLDGLPAQHEVGLFTMGAQTRLRVNFTTDRDALRAQAATIFPDQTAGMALVVDGLYETWERRFDDDDSWPVFVLALFDGGGRVVNESTFNAFARELTARGATVHAVLVRNWVGSLQELVSSYLTQTTGGIYNPIAAANGLPGVLSDLATAVGAHHDAVKDRYRVAYECDPDDLDTPITVTATRPEIAVSAFPDRGRSSPNGSEPR